MTLSEGVDGVNRQATKSEKYYRQNEEKITVYQ